MARTTEEKRRIRPSAFEALQKKKLSHAMFSRAIMKSKSSAKNFMDSGEMTKPLYSAIAQGFPDENIMPEVDEDEFGTIKHTCSKKSYQVDRVEFTDRFQTSTKPPRNFEHKNIREILPPLLEANQLLTVAAQGHNNTVVFEDEGPFTGYFPKQNIREAQWAMAQRTPDGSLLEELNRQLSAVKALPNTTSGLDELIHNVQRIEKIDETLAKLNTAGISIFGKRIKSFSPYFTGDFMNPDELEYGLLVFASSSYWFVEAECQKWVEVDDAELSIKSNGD